MIRSVSILPERNSSFQRYNRAMNEPASSTLSGRRAEAARNDETILAAARAVFIADPGAPISAVAAHAGVGMSALYRRYRNKEDMIQRLWVDGLREYIAEAEAAIAAEGEPWEAFVRFMHRSVDNGSGALTLRFAAVIMPTDELRSLGPRTFDVIQQLLNRVKESGTLRADVEVGDIGVLLEQIQSIHLADPERTSILRHRFLTLALDGMSTSSPSPLPGPARHWTELRGRPSPGPHPQPLSRSGRERVRGEQDRDNP
jgi:AcrR family transcriptional regulator